MQPADYAFTTAFQMGFAHPLGGIDHIVVMLAVGLWAASVGGRALWLWPLTFVAMMLAGFGIASMGGALPFAELAIALSVVALGLVISFGVRAPAWLGALMVGLFAFVHGHVHGTEAMVVTSDRVDYAAGFALATALLHIAGLALGLRASRLGRPTSMRATGLVITMIGAAVAAGLS